MTGSRMFTNIGLVMALFAVMLGARLVFGGADVDRHNTQARDAEPAPKPEPVKSRTIPTPAWRSASANVARPRFESQPAQVQPYVEEGAAGSGQLVPPMHRHDNMSVSAARFEAEPAVAPSAREQRVVELFDAANLGAALLSIECRETLCRLEVDLNVARPGDPALQVIADALLQSPRVISFENQRALVVIAADNLDV